jgi:hypothetical protein
MGVKSIQSSELEPLARRIWYAGAPRAWWFSNHEKHASFEAMGIPDDSPEFPMPSEEWVPAGDYEINISYSLGEIPGVIRVRRSAVYTFRVGAKVCFAAGGVDPLRVLAHTMREGLPEYKVQSKSRNIFYVREWEIESYRERPKHSSNKRRIEIDGSIYYVPWTSGADPTNPYRSFNREDVVNALRHISKQSGTTVLPWSVAEQLAGFYDGTVSSNYEDIARWWKPISE